MMDAAVTAIFVDDDAAGPPRRPGMTKSRAPR